MIYQGSKKKLLKYILPILQDCIDKNHITTYIEPFVGGANVIDSIKCDTRIGSDINEDLINLLKYMQKDSTLSIFPDECSVEHYKDVRSCLKNKTDKYSAEYIAGIGYFASYGGRYFDGGYGRDKSGKRNIFKERLKNAKEQACNLKGIKFETKSFIDYDPKEYKNCLFYLDPPYKNTKAYNNINFPQEDFYNWIKKIAKHNFVFISEYDMPKDFKCIWKKETKVNQKSNRSKANIAVEKLFVM